MTARTTDGAAYVDLATWGALAAGQDGAELEQLAGAPGLDLALAATAEPQAVVQLDIASPGGVFSHHAWVAEDAFALLVDDGRDERRLVCLPPDHLPAALARLVGLGPRTTAARRQRDLTAADLEAWFAPQPERRRAALAILGADRAWRLGLVAAGASPEESLLMAVADGPGGPWLVEHGDDAPRAVPVDATFVFTAFAGLLPASG